MRVCVCSELWKVHRGSKDKNYHNFRGYSLAIWGNKPLSQRGIAERKTMLKPTLTTHRTTVPQIEHICQSCYPWTVWTVWILFSKFFAFLVVTKLLLEKCSKCSSVQRMPTKRKVYSVYKVQKFNEFNEFNRGLAKKLSELLNQCIVCILAHLI